jgi:hypothetical protein
VSSGEWGSEEWVVHREKEGQVANGKGGKVVSAQRVVDSDQWKAANGEAVSSEECVVGSDESRVTSRQERTSGRHSRIKREQGIGFREARLSAAPGHFPLSTSYSLCSCSPLFTTHSPLGLVLQPC